jgi:hypothetical protein
VRLFALVASKDGERDGGKIIGETAKEKKLGGLGLDGKLVFDWNLARLLHDCYAKKFKN